MLSPEQREAKKLLDSKANGTNKPPPKKAESGYPGKSVGQCGKPKTINLQPEYPT